ncbi:glutamyl aminopeptidase-like isoform X1 [Schistocerca serialis cubense]|uniref:glutamyl aminopeptidase-like isoform X1 n=2 Tax=Schistocerca serialis cubense TaxID=2023355 RepID=UPI00214EE427|nr:glutamyl aminopeptidase-like isoform X1 [Schistocerca serialis cubense]
MRLALATGRHLVVWAAVGGAAPTPVPATGRRLLQPAWSTGLRPAFQPAMTSAAAPLADWESGTRLPADVRPLHYDLELRPDLSAGAFTGNVSIAVRVSAPRRWVALHSRGLRVSGAALAPAPAGVAVPLERAFEAPRAERYVLVPAQPLQPGDYRLSLHFAGSLDVNLVGFYRSRYTDKDTGQRRNIATSKFQPTYARQAFPCFDEPGFKARFSVRIVRPTEGYHALSNMNVESELNDSPDTGFTTVQFAESVPMVTYLACFIVSDFQRLAPVPILNADGTTFPFSVYSSPAQVSKTAFALEDGVAITKYYISYFGIGYPLPKLDMVAIPDYVSGATEHWGVITFRETNLLYDQTISSVSNKQRVATVIAHELAHMWFGNLMTLKWWDDLWLNEGFATYIEYKGVNAAHSEWGMLDQFLVDDLHPVFVLDATLSSRPIVKEVSTPDQITEIFDVISYNKGAAVIRMLEDFLGSEAFRLGISAFLKKYEFDNAVTSDLWTVLQEQVTDDGIEVASVMDTWTRQMGYPVVEVLRGLESGSRFLSQKRFLSNPKATYNASDTPYGYKWAIPITYITSDNPTETKRLWLQPTETQKKLEIGNATWLKLNRHEVGYYRVNYEYEDWNALISLLKTNTQSLDTADRAHLLDDAFSLAAAGQLRYETALELTRYLSNETEYVPWVVATTHFTKMFHLLQGSDEAHGLLKVYLQEQIEDVYNSLAWNVNDTDGHLQRRLRIVALELACLAALPACLQQVQDEFDGWLVQPDYRPHPDLRTLVYHYGMSANGSFESWEQMWQLYVAETDAQERTKLLYGLAGIQNEEAIRRYLNYTKDESLIRSQDFFTVIGYISGNPVGSQIIWDFYRNEWEYLVERFTLNNRYLGQLIRTITKYFSSQEKLDEMKAFFEKYPEAGAGTAARSQALETVEGNIQWLSSYHDTIKMWLSVKPIPS